MNSTTSCCPELRGMAQKLADAILCTLKYQQEATQNTDGASPLLDQARAAQREVERTLNDHIERHGCLTFGEVKTTTIDHKAASHAGPH